MVAIGQADSHVEQQAKPLVRLHRRSREPPLLSANALALEPIFSAATSTAVRARAKECEWRRALRGGPSHQAPKVAGRPSPRPLELSLTTDAPVLLRVRR